MQKVIQSGGAILVKGRYGKGRGFPNEETVIWDCNGCI